MKPIGLDVGTAFVVATAEDASGQETAALERNCYLVLPDNAPRSLPNQDLAIMTVDGVECIVGEQAAQAARFIGAFATGDKTAGLHRPMRTGCLNPDDKLGAAMLTVIINSVIDAVAEGSQDEPFVVFSVPSTPVDAERNPAFHQAIVEGILRKRGQCAAIVEGLAVIYAAGCSGIVDGEELPFSGIGVSWGAGQTNVCVALRGMPLLHFSVAKGGDWIDEEVASAVGVSIPQATYVKEQEVDLSRPTSGDLVAQAVCHFYNLLVATVMDALVQQIAPGISQLRGAQLPVVLSGGTASVPGFEGVVHEALEQRAARHGIELRSVTVLDDPLYAVSRGCLVNAMVQCAQ